MTPLLKQLGVAMLYALLVYLDHRYFESGTAVSSFEAASGYALAVLLIGGRQYAWSVFLGSILGNITINPLGATIAIASGHALEAFCGAWMLRYNYQFEKSLRDYLFLLLKGGIFGIGVGANFGIAVLIVFGYTTPESFFHELLHWWSGDLLGVALITPLILVFWQTQNDWHGTRQMAEAALLLGLTFLAGQIVFLGWFHDIFGHLAMGYWMFLFIVWVAVRLRTRGTVVAMTMIATQSTLSAFHGIGFFAEDIPRTQLGNYWFYTLTLSVVGMALATFITERKRTEETLSRSELKFRTLFDSTSDAVLLLNENGFFDCNHAALAMLGCATKEVLCTKHPADLSPPEQPCGTSSLALAHRHIATAMEKGSHRFEWTCKRDDNGKMFIVEVLLGTVELDGNHALQVIAHDITEKKLAESELQRFFDLVPDMVCIASTDGYIKKINRAWQTTLGYTEQEILDTPFLDFIHPDDREGTMQEVGRQLAERIASPFCNRYRHKDGSYKLLEWSMIPPVDRTLLYGSARDITERKKAEVEKGNALQKTVQAQAMLQTVLDSTPDWIFSKDKNHRFLFVNNAFAVAQGRTPQGMVGCPDTDFWPPELCLGDPARGIRGFHADDDAAMAGQTLHNPNDIATLADGEEHIFDTLKLPLLDAAGQCYGMLGYARDITERKQVETELRESEERLRGIMNNTSAVIFLKDTAGRYLLANTQYEKLFHVSSAAMQGKTDHDIFPKDMADAFIAADKKVIRTGHPLEVEERVPQDDSIHTYISVKFPLHNVSGEIYAVCGISTDITERKAYEQQLHDLSAHLLSVREEEKTLIAREIHDELGGTLTALKMDAYWLSRKLPANEETAPFLERIHSISRLVDNAVGVTRRIISNLRPTLLDDLGILAAIEWQAMEFHKHSDIECRVNCVEDEANLDKQRSITLFRILQETLTNVTRHSGASKVEIEFLHNAKEVILTVNDNGRGILKNQITPSKSYGMLGMTERVEQLGGKIIFSSPPGGGFGVAVTLPLPADNGKKGET